MKNVQSFFHGLFFMCDCASLLLAIPSPPLTGSRAKNDKGYIDICHRLPVGRETRVEGANLFFVFL